MRREERVEFPETRNELNGSSGRRPLPKIVHSTADGAIFSDPFLAFSSGEGGTAQP